MLFSALEIADLTVLLTSFAILFLENSKSLRATSAFFPFIKLQTKSSFLGLVLTFLFIAFTIELFLFHYFLSPSGLAAGAAAFLSAGVWPLKVLVGANSPNL